MTDVDLIDRLRAARLYVVSGDAHPAHQARVLCDAIDGGADVVQLRNKQAPAADLFGAAVRVRDHARARSAIFIVNDHLELAIDAGADGVHLGQEDLGIAEARLRWDGIVGRSTHSLEQAVKAQTEGADYIGVGPVFATPTKPGRPAVGVGLLGLVGAVLEIPWFAIGGLDAGNIDAVVIAGARRVAVVRAVSSAADPAAAAAELKARLATPVGGTASA
jgi:thiamine-phosphate pyrophosphorylase